MTESQTIAELLVLDWSEIVRRCRTMADREAGPRCRALVDSLVHYEPRDRRDYVAGVLRKHVPIAAWLAALAEEAIDPPLTDLVARAFVAWMQQMPQSVAKPVGSVARKVHSFEWAGCVTALVFASTPWVCLPYRPSAALNPSTVQETLARPLFTN